MKKIFLVLTVFIGLAAVASCQTTIKTGGMPATTDSTHVMLHPDANTEYFDEAGTKIDDKTFGGFLKSGQYTMAPVVENGKLKSIRLKKSTVSQVKPGTVAPDFVLTDINGQKFALKELKGKTIVLNFWFTTCAPCIMEMPELNGLVEKYKNDPNVVFLAVTHDPADQVKNFLSKKAFKFNIAAGQMELINRYGVSSYPTSMVIDKTGGVAFALTAYDGTNVAQLEGVIQALKGQ